MRWTTQTLGPQRSSALRKQIWVPKGQKRAKSPLKLPASALPTSPSRKELASRPLQRSPGGQPGQDARRAVPPAPRAPAGIFLRAAGRRRFPRPSSKPLAAGARASPRPKLYRAAPPPSPLKAPPPLPPPPPPPPPPPQTPTLDQRRSSLFRESGEVPPLGGARGGAGPLEGVSSGSVCRGGAVAAC